MISGGRVIHYWHSCYREQKKLRKLYPDPLVQLNPDTARELDISDGDWVYIETPEGRIRQRASLMDGIHPKVVHIDGYWYFPERFREGSNFSGLLESTSNSIIPNDPSLFDYAGDYSFRALLCKVYK